MRVLITQSAQDSRVSTAALEARGHQVLTAPLVTAERPEVPKINFAGAQGFLVTSAEGARALADNVGVRTFPVFADSEMTAASLRRFGFKHVEAAKDDSADLARLVERTITPAGGALIYACSTAAPINLSAMLSNMGFAVRPWPLYTLKRAEQMPDIVRAALKNRTLDAALFLSADEARAFVALVQRDELEPLVRELPCVAATPVVAAPLRALKLGGVSVPQAADLDTVFGALDLKLVDRVEEERAAREARAREDAERRRLEEERQAQERAERERLAREQAERERVEKERLAAELAAREQAARDKAEQERIAREQAERERAERKRLEQEQAEKEREARRLAEQERIAQERAAKERAAQERSERERLDRERLAAEKTERDRITAEKAAADKIEHERQKREQREREEQVAKERAEKDRLDRERLAAEKAERDRIAAEKAAADKAERERLAKERAERERLDRERLAAEKVERDRITAEKAAAAKTERERLAKERAEQDRLERERLAAEKAERDRIAREQIAQAKSEQERLALEAAERQRQEHERLAAEKAERDRQTRERREREEQAAREKAEAERIARELAAREQAERDRVERERLAAEKIERDRQTREQREREEQTAREKAEADRAERDRVAHERAERDRVAAEKAALEKAEHDRVARAKAVAEQAERERHAREKAEEDRQKREQREREEQAAREKSAAERAEKARIAAAYAAHVKQEKARAAERKAEEKAERRRLDQERRQQKKAARPPSVALPSVGLGTLLMGWLGRRAGAPTIDSPGPGWGLGPGIAPDKAPSGAPSIAVAPEQPSATIAPPAVAPPLIAKALIPETPKPEPIKTPEIKASEIKTAAPPAKEKQNVPENSPSMADDIAAENPAPETPEAVADSKPGARGGGRAARLLAEDAADLRAQDQRFKYLGHSDAPAPEPEAVERSAASSATFTFAPMPPYGTESRGGVGRIAVLFVILAVLAATVMGTASWWVPRVTQIVSGAPATSPNAPTETASPLQADVNALKARLSVLEQQAGSAATTDSLNAAKQELAQRLVALEARGKSQDGEAVTSLGDSLSSQAKQLTAVSARIATLEAAIGNSARLEDLSKRLNMLEGRSAEANSVLALSDRVTSLETSARRTMVEQSTNIALLMAVAQWREAVLAGHPFALELQTAKTLASRAGAMTIDDSGFATAAAQGIPTLPDLQRRFSAAAAAAMRADVIPNDTAAWYRRILDRMLSIMTVRRLDGDAAGTSVSAILARAQRRLTDGDLGAAVAEMNGLSGNAATAVELWLTLAKTRVAAEHGAAEATIKSVAIVAGTANPSDQPTPAANGK